MISEAFPDRFEAAPLIEAGTVRLPLPVGVRQVRIWQNAPKQAGSRVALQYRASRMPDLDEAAYAEESAAWAGSRHWRCSGRPSSPP